MNTNHIVERAAVLEVTMNHGDACFLACREAGVPELEIPALASVVSAAVINRPLPKAEPVVLTDAMRRRFAADQARLEKQRAASRAANARRIPHL